MPEEVRLEPELASIAKHVIEIAVPKATYYNEIPEGFKVPCIYFPTPEISSDADTTSTYKVQYVWLLHFFHCDTPLAYDLALRVLTSIREERNLIPLYDFDGIETGKVLRIKDPRLIKLDSGVVQLEIIWDSRRPYNAPPSLKMEEVHFDFS